MNQLPAHLQNYQSRGLAKTATANLGTSAPPYISLSENRFTAVDPAGNEVPLGAYEQNQQACLHGQFVGVYLDVHIIDMNEHVSRIYFDPDKPYDPKAPSYEPPSCFSNNGVGPSRQASRPQAALCATCPQSEWGSAISNVSGKEIPACSQYQFIAVTVPGTPLADRPLLIRVPPNSLKNFRAYAEKFAGQPFDMDAVLTRISFPSQGTIAFCAVNYVDQQTFGIAQQILADRRTDGLLGKNDMARDPNTVAITQQAPQAIAYNPATAGGAMGGPAPGGAAFAPQPGQFQGTPGAAAAQPGQPLSGQVMPPQGAPQAPQEAPRGRGRGRPRAPAQPAQAPFAPQAPQQAPFAPQQPVQAPFAPQAPQQAAPAPSTQPGAPFGVQSGVAPNADVQAALGKVFG